MPARLVDHRRLGLPVQPPPTLAAHPSAASYACTQDLLKVIGANDEIPSGRDAKELEKSRHDIGTFLYVPREGNFTAAELVEYPEQQDCKGYLTKIIDADFGKGGKSSNPHYRLLFADGGVCVFPLKKAFKTRMALYQMAVIIDRVTIE